MTIKSNTQRQLDALKEVRSLLAKPSAWTKGAYARDPEGNPTKTDATVACCFCLSGAICKVIGAPMEDEGHDALVRTLFPNGDSGSAIQFNDDPFRTHDEVLIKIDSGIAYLEAR